MPVSRTIEILVFGKGGVLIAKRRVQLRLRQVSCSPEIRPVQLGARQGSIP
jgi:hypothetical protein